MASSTIPEENEALLRDAPNPLGDDEGFGAITPLPNIPKPKNTYRRYTSSDTELSWFSNVLNHISSRSSIVPINLQRRWERIFGILFDKKDAIWVSHAVE